MTRISAFLLAFSIAVCFSICPFKIHTNAEGLTDEQLYGYEPENVLGHKSKENNYSNYNYSYKNANNNPCYSSEITNISNDIAQDKEISKDAKVKETKKDNKAAVRVLDIVVIGVEDDEYYNEDCNLSIYVDGATSEDQVEASVKLKTFEGKELRHDIVMEASKDGFKGNDELKDEGEYSLDVQILKGMNVIKHLNKNFVIDKTAPVFNEELLNELIVKEIDSERIKKEVISDYSPFEARLKINGKEVDKIVASQAGEYDLELEARDKAGNTASANANAVIGNSPKKTDEIKQQSSYHQLIGLAMLVGSLLFYKERRKSDVKEDNVNE